MFLKEISMAQTNKTKYIDFGGLTLIVNGIKVGATKPGQLGTDLSGTELGALDVTAGTLTASKAIVVDASSKIDALKIGTFSITGPAGAAVAAGTTSGSAGTTGGVAAPKVLVVDVNGTAYYIPLYSQNT
jgi:hypothetical protein